MMKILELYWNYTVSYLYVYMYMYICVGDIQ